jgi:glycosyltransferase involved in cell wall biosynthesis
MKIAHFLSNFPLIKDSPAYGKSLAAYNVCKGLVNRGHQVTVFTNTDPKSDSLYQFDGINIYNFSSRMGYKSERFSIGILFEPLTMDFDIIHIHSGISVPTYAGYRYARKKGKPLIITWHGDSIRNPDIDRYTGIIPGIASYSYKYFGERFLDHSTKIISVSEAYIASSKFLGAYQQKIRVIPNGIQLNDYSINHTKEEYKIKLGLKDEIVILFMGSLDPIKGLDILFEAIPTIIKNYKNILLVIAGGGKLRYYQNLANQSNISGYVKFLGYIKEEKIDYLAASDIFVLPSYAECFPLVNLEAMASGLPIIASNVGGIPDVIVDRVNGLLVPPGDPEKLADAIIQLIKDPQFRLDLGNEGKKIAENYSWSNICKLTEDLYFEILKEGDSHNRKR